uniref:Uncharacterized protein n=1 Tax=Burkholderia sp. (strain CCGE1003) TaxID=640512 RepID=E1TJG4_BURSG
MTTRIRSLARLGLVCASCFAGMSNAGADDRLLKLLQLQTLKRTAPAAPPTKKNQADDNSKAQQPGADRWSAQPQTQPDNRRPPGSVTPGRQP